MEPFDVADAFHELSEIIREMNDIIRDPRDHLTRLAKCDECLDRLMARLARATSPAPPET